MMLQLIYSFFASAAARGLCTSAMVEAGVLEAMRDDPVLGLVRQASADKQASKPVVLRLWCMAPRWTFRQSTAIALI